MQKLTSIHGWGERLLLHANTNANAGSEQKSFLKSQAWQPISLTTLGCNLGKQSCQGYRHVANEIHPAREMSGNQRIVF